MDARIEAIRGDKKVGRHTCSVIAECYSDAELAAALDEAGIRPTSRSAAITWARKTHNAYHAHAAEVERW